MKSPPRHPAEPSRFLLLFPLFSPIFHITLFFILQSLSSTQHTRKIKDDEIIAMVDLESLNLPNFDEEETLVLPLPLPLPEEVPALEPESIHLGGEALSLPGGAGLPGLEGQMTDSVFNAPISIPEEASTLPEPEETFQDLEESQAEPESLPEEAPVEVAGEEALLPEPEAEPDAAPEAPPSEIAPADSALASADETEAPETGSGAVAEAFPGEGGGGTSASGEDVASNSEQALSSELATSDASADSGEESLEEGLLASAQTGVKKTKPTPALRKKTSEAKIKKVGLLGLLGGGGIKSKSGGGRLLVAKKRLRLKTRASEKERRFPGRSLKSIRKVAGQKAAGLRKKVVSSEKKRLMKRRFSGRRGRAGGIKIVHGSGRNYGIISSAIRQKKGRLTNVYNRLLQNDENLQGNLIIEFVISPEGRVIKSQILTSSISNPSFEKALIKEILRWKFPSVKTGQTTVLYPLSFFPSS